MTHHLYKRIQTDFSFADLCVTVFMTSQSIHAVIKMNRFQSGKSDHLVKFCQYSIQIMYNVIASIPDVTGIQADPQFVFSLHAVNDLFQFLKR